MPKRKRVKGKNKKDPAFDDDNNNNNNNNDNSNNNIAALLPQKTNESQQRRKLSDSGDSSSNKKIKLEAEKNQPQKNKKDGPPVEQKNELLSVDSINDDNNKPQQSPKQSVLLPHLVQLVNAIEHNNNYNNYNNKCSESSIRTLIQHLKEKVLDENSPLSLSSLLLLLEIEMAQLLLSWAVKQIQYIQNSPQQEPSKASLLLLPYEAMNVSLQTILVVPKQTKSTKTTASFSLATLLPLGTLNKLVPTLALHAIGQTDGDGNNTDSGMIYTTLLSPIPTTTATTRTNATLVLFTPTLEFALHSILLPMIELFCHPTAVRNSTFGKLFATTLGWIHDTLFPRGNPKTNFGLLIQPIVMTALSKLYSHFSNHENHGVVVQNGILKVIATGIMSAQQNLEGLLSVLLSRKKNKQKPSGAGDTNIASFRTYQEEFLSCLAAALEQNDAQLVRTIHVIEFLPVLYSAFLIQVQEFKNFRQRQSASASASATKKQQQQRALTASASEAAFELFVLMTEPLLKIWEGTSRNQDVASSVIASLRLLTRLLFDHNVYIAAQDDAQQSQFQFLQRWADFLFMESAADRDTGGIKWELTTNTIGFLQNLLELNHALIQDHRLVQAVMLVCYCADPDSNSACTTVAAEQFFVCVMETYQKLRQQGNLIRTLLQVLSFPRDDKSSTTVAKNLECLALQHPVVRAALARTICASPMDEVDSVFREMQEWCAATATTIPEKDTAAERVLPVAVELFAIVFQAVPVHASTASATVSLVQRFSQNVVETLLEKKTTLMRLPAAMKLTAWLIRLQDRCAFWLGREHQFQIPSSLTEEIQQEVANYLNKGASERSVNEATLLLVSHRLQQIVSLVHDEQLARIHNNAVDEKESENENKLNAEGRQLASFMISAANCEVDSFSVSTKNSRRRAWIYICQCVQIWALYATENAIERFLDWLFSALGSSDCDEEKQVAMELIGDMSFLDISPIGTLLHWAALEHVSKIISLALQTKRSHVWSKFISLLQAKPNDSVAHLDPSLVDLLSRLEWTDIWTTGNGAESVVESLTFANQLPRELLENFPFVGSYFQRAAVLEWALVSSLVPSQRDSESQSLLVACVGELRTTLGRSLSILLANNNNNSLDRENDTESNETMLSPFGSFDALLEYTQHIFVSTAALLADKEEFFKPDNKDKYRGTINNLLTCTQKFLTRLYRLIFFGVGVIKDSDEKSKRLTRVMDSVSASKSSPNGALFAMKCLLQGAEKARAGNILKKEHTQTLWSFCSTQLDELFHKTACPSQLHLGRSVLGELIRRIKAWSIDSTQEVQETLKRMERLVRQDVKKSASFSPDERRAIYFNLGCLAQACPCHSLAAVIVDELEFLAETGDNWIESSKLLKAAFCELVTRLSEEECGESLEKVLSSTKSFVAMDVFTLLIGMRCITEEDQTIVAVELSKRGRDIFNLPMRHLHNQRRWDSTEESLTRSSLDLLGALIKRKEVFSLGGKDLVLVLSRLNVVVGGRLARDETSVISLPIFFCMRSLDEKSLKNTELETKCNEVCRLCESLGAHKEVYKKHVVGLILEFVHHPDASSNAKIKNALLPSVYCLLDLLSVHETQQLNALMQTQAKPMFRSVYQTYRKRYAYKGQ